MLTLNRIMALLNIHGKQQKDLAEELGIKKNNITDWKSGKSKSYTKYLPQIAGFFGVSIDYLTGGVGSLDTALFKHIDSLCKNKKITFFEALEQAGFTNEEIDQYYAGNRGIIFTRKKELATVLNDDESKWESMAFVDVSVTNNFSTTQETFVNNNQKLTEDEKELIQAYRDQPEMHEAIKKLLGISDKKEKAANLPVRVAARSGKDYSIDGEEDTEIKVL